MSRKYIDERLIVIIPCLLPLLVLSNCLCAVCNMRLFGLFHTLYTEATLLNYWLTTGEARRQFFSSIVWSRKLGPSSCSASTIDFYYNQHKIIRSLDSQEFMVLWMFSSFLNHFIPTFTLKNTPMWKFECKMIQEMKLGTTKNQKNR